MTKDFLSRISKLSPKRLALLAAEMQEKIESLEQADREPIAIIGLGCRIPGASSGANGYWQLLRDGVDAISEVPLERWDSAANYDPDPDAPGRMATCWGGFLNNPYLFDAGFFGIAPREAISMDPQQRLLLEVTWETLEDAGIDPDSLGGSRTGVFVGICNSDYAQILVSRPPDEFDAYLATGSSHSVAAGRLSYVLGLQGPCVAVDTSCSSSLVAVHMACQSLRSQESSLALAGGVNLILAPQVTIALSRAHMMAPDGRCKTFDNAADGFVRGEGCGMVVLKRLSDAERDGDRILAVVRGSASNQDGRSGGLTAPNGPAQEAVLNLALANAGLGPESVSYVETHGTGTSLGDPIEVHALGEVLCAGRSKSEPLYIGSVKTNIGHLEAAAGIAGLIKVVLSLQHGEIPAHLHLKRKNTHVDWDQYAIEIATERIAWPARGGKRIAGVSSFGFSGTNAHVIVEEAPERKVARVEKDRPVHVLTVSAKSEAALQEMVTRYREHLEEHAEESLGDVAYTANAGRAHFAHRLAVVANSREILLKQLTEYEVTGPKSGVVRGEVHEGQAPKIAFLFSGQGSQYAGMGRELYESSEVYRAAVDRCVKAAEGEMKRPLLEVMWGDEKELGETRYTQPALYALEWGLAELWKSWGIEPSVVLGHSVGEYVAAAVAGVLGVEEGMRLVVERGRLMQGLGAGGAMLAVRAGVERVREVMEKHAGRVSVGAVNGPESVVLSGWADGIGEIEKELGKQGVVVKRLGVSHGFHSPQMEGILDQWERVAQNINYSQPNIPLASNVTGELVEDGRMSTANYWRRHLREPVQFMAGLKAVAADGSRIFLEIGPHPVLTGMGREFVTDPTTSWLASLRKGHSEWRGMLESVAELYARGAQINWKEFDREYDRSKLELPTYPFQRKKYGIEVRKISADRPASDSRIERGTSNTPFADWFYELEWRPARRVNAEKIDESLARAPGNGHASKKLDSNARSHWLIFADHLGVADSLAAILASRNEPYTLVRRGTQFEKFSPRHFALRPDAREDFERLFSELDERETGAASPVVFLWSLDAVADNKSTDAAMMREKLFQNCIPIANLMQSLDGAKNSPRRKLWMGTNGAQYVTPKKDGFGLVQASAWGLGRVYALEHAEMWGGLIDIDADARGNSKQAADRLYDEISFSDGEDQVAFRGDDRYVARLVRAESPATGLPEFRSDRTYLITGGLGEVGLETAEWMVGRGARCLVLLSRHALASGDRRLQTIRRMEASGARVHVVSADVADFEQMKALLARVNTEMPPLAGIFHLATDMSFAPIDDIQPSQIFAMLGAKAAGAWILHLLTEKMDLDYFVLFSSMASIWGAWGLAHYAAASQFVDLLAYERRASGLPAVVVNWSRWDTMSMNSGGQRQLHEDLGMFPMGAENALNALGFVMTSGKTRMGVADVDWKTLRAAYESNHPNHPRPLFAQIDAQPCAPGDSSDFAGISRQLGSRFVDLVEKNGLASYAELSRKVDLLCSSYIVAALRRMGFDFFPGKLWDVPELAKLLGIIPGHWRAFDRMIEVLAEDGVLARDQNRLEVRMNPPAVDPEKLQQELIHDFDAYKNEIEVLGRCAGKLDLVLRGECNVLHLLFPDGSLIEAEHMYQKSPVNRTYNLLLADALSAVSKGLQSSPLRILEIGAGTGASTAYMLPMLSGLAVEYVFTDIAQLFLTNGKRKFKEYPWVRFETFDLEKEPASQGFEEHQFDVVIAANVVHATSNLRRSLQRVRQMLAPGGVLLLLELTCRSRGVDLTVGLTDGWWKFEDADLRTSYPLLERGPWKRLLAEVGFSQVEIVPGEKDENAATQQTLIFGREPLGAKQTRTRNAAQPVSRGAVERRSVPADWLETIGTLTFEERRTALGSQIRREVAAVLNLDADDSIREDQSFSSLGLDSLTALELKNCLQQRLCCTLPPTVAFRYPTIRAMSEFLESVLEKNAGLNREVNSSSQREELEW